MNKLTKIATATSLLLGLGMAGAANASPILQIVDGTGAGMLPPAASPACPPGDVSNCEVTGDAGGTSYPWPNANIAGGAGAGVPSAAAGWPVGPGFGVDGSFNNALGTSGWHSSYLNLTQSANVTFQYMGDGNAANHNQFELFLGGVWNLLFDNNVTAPCAVAPAATAPTNCAAGSTGTFFINAGLVPFRYLASIGTAPDTFTNDGRGNPDPHGNRGGYFLGVDPYLATGVFQNSGTTVYAGLTDLPGAGDHDFQDMAVRISVPEPGSIFLLGLGLLGLVAGRSRISRSV